MNTLGELTQSILGAVDTGSNILGDYTRKEAQFSTTTKKYNLQADINDKMQKIAMNGNYKTWQTEINSFFENIKSKMNDPESQYYCRNNLQAKMFDEVLNDSLVSVGNRVSMMVMQKQMSQMGVDRDQAINRLIEQGITGNDFVQQANEIDEAYWLLNGEIDPKEKQQVREQRYIYGYTSEKEAYFDNSLKAAIKRGESAEALIDNVNRNSSAITASNADGSPMAIDTKGIDAKLNKEWHQKYDAALKDYQDENANQLSRILEQMRQVNTEEEKVKIAQHGQNTMKRMKDHDLSKNDRNFYSAAFELSLDGGMKGRGSGKGAKQGDFDKYEDLIKLPGNALMQMWEEGLKGSMYDITDFMAQEYTKQFFTKPWQENWNKTEKEAQNTFDFRFAGRVSKQGLAEAVEAKLLDKFPEIKEKLGKEFANLRKDMQKHPKEYGTDNVEKMAYWLLDAVYSADPKTTTSKDILEQWEKYKNDCYLDRIKYVELKNINDKNSLVKKFDATKPDQIAQAARLSMEKDYVYTWQDKEVWADGKKEALEAPGGVINVLQNGLIGTLDIPQSDVEAGKVGFKYKQTEYDMTSQPIFTYNGKEYEVIPNENNKGFKVLEYTLDEEGQRQSVREIEGKIGGKSAEERAAEKAAAKAAAKETVQTSHTATRTLEDNRAEERITAIQESKEMPPAMKGTGKIKAEKWETGSDIQKQAYLEDTEYTINQEAKKIESAKKKKDTEKETELQDEFYKKYKIRYYDWSNASGKEERMKLILNSK